MMPLSVTLVARDGIGVGTLHDHPAAPQVRTRRLPGGRLGISLWAGRHQIGEGELHNVNGVWTGTTSEYAGRWFVRGKIGSGVLEFTDGDIA